LTMTFAGPLDFARHLERVQRDLAAAEAAALEQAGTALLDAARAGAVAQGGDAAIVAEHTEMTVTGNAVTIGVPERMVQPPGGGPPVNVGEIAERVEFGVAGDPPRSFLAATMFRHGEAAAEMIGTIVGGTLAGAAPVRRARALADGDGRPSRRGAPGGDLP
jgi:hypothetical protein